MTLVLRRIFERTWPALIVAASAVLVMLPIMFWGITKGADLPNHFHFALPFYDELRAGHWHPGWLADSNWGYGDARFRFYPPGLYYLLAAVRAVAADWYSATIIVFIVLTVVGSLGAYLWARQFCEPKWAMFAGIVYLLAPYHLNELYQASLLSEYAAGAVLPFAFMFVERVCQRRNYRDLAGLAASYALLVLTHLPLTVIGSLALLVYALLRIERKNFVGTAVRLGLGVGLGLSASVFFWGTMLAELNWIKGGSVAANIYYDYRVNFIFTRASLTNLNTWYANVLALALIGFLLPGLLFVPRLLRHSQRGIMATVAVTIVSFLMATPISRPVWAVVPKLSEVQFPWRWLAITCLTGSVMVAVALPHFLASLRRGWQPRKLAIVLAFGVSLYYVGSHVIFDTVYLSRQQFATMLHDLPGALSFKDWTPVAAGDLLHIQKMQSKVEAGDRETAITSWQNELRTFHLGPGSETTARIWTYYYPHWTAYAGGHALPVTSSTDGVIQVTVPPTATDVELVFQEPKRVQVAALISLLAWLAIAIVAGVSNWPLGARRRFSDHSIQNSPLINPSLALE